MFDTVFDYVGSHWSSIWEAKSIPNRSKMKVQTVSCSKTWFFTTPFKIKWISIIFDLTIRTKTTPKRPKRGPKELPFSSSIYASILDRFWLHFGSLLGPFPGTFKLPRAGLRPKNCFLEVLDGLVRSGMLKEKLPPNFTTNAPEGSELWPKNPKKLKTIKCTAIRKFERIL